MRNFCKILYLFSFVGKGFWVETGKGFGGSAKGITFGGSAKGITFFAIINVFCGTICQGDCYGYPKNQIYIKYYSSTKKQN